MTPQNDQERGALAEFASEMSRAFAKLAGALGQSEVPDRRSRHYWETRQARVIKEIQDAGGSVDYGTWRLIAERNGYAGRGSAGFFRSDGTGLLNLTKDRRVQVTKRGRKRLAEYRDLVAGD